MADKRNKQRITKLTKTEKAAAESTGGVLDETIPENEVLDLLRSMLGTAFDADRLLRAIRNAVGRYRHFQCNAEADIPRADIQSQAKQTAAVIDELLARIQYMHPDIRRICDEVHYTAFGEPFSERRIESELYHLRAMLERAVAELSEPDRAGARGKHYRTRALRTICDEIAQSSSLQKGEAKKLAAEILARCGIEMPEDVRDADRKRGGSEEVSVSISVRENKNWDKPRDAWRIELAAELKLANKADWPEIIARAKRAETLKQNQCSASTVLSPNDKATELGKEKLLSPTDNSLLPAPKHDTQAEIAKASK